MSEHVFESLTEPQRNWSSSTSFQTSTTISFSSSPASNLKVCVRFTGESVLVFSLQQKASGLLVFHGSCRRTHPFAEWPDPEEQRQGPLPELPTQCGGFHQARMPEQHRRPVAADQSYNWWVSDRGGRKGEKVGSEKAAVAAFSAAVSQAST